TRFSRDWSSDVCSSDLNTAFLGTGERQTHVVEFKNSLRTNGAHVLDRVLVADVVRTLDGVVHVPAPIVLRIGRGDRAGNAALGGYRVRTGREYLGNYRGLVTGLRQLQRSAHTGAAATDDNAVKRNRANSGHALSTPQDLDAPDDINKQDNGNNGLERQTDHIAFRAHQALGEIIGGHRPQTDPRMGGDRQQCSQTEDAHGSAGEQRLPGLDRKSTRLNSSHV